MRSNTAFIGCGNGQAFIAAVRSFNPIATSNLQGLKTPAQGHSCSHSHHFLFAILINSHSVKMISLHRGEGDNLISCP